MTDLTVDEEYNMHGFKQIITRQKNLVDKDILVICFCGAEWTHPLNTSEDQMYSILDSHRKYFNKPKMQTL